MGEKMNETDEPPSNKTTDEISSLEGTGDLLEHFGIFRFGRDIFLIGSGKLRKGFAVCGHVDNCVLYQ